MEKDSHHILLSTCVVSSQPILRMIMYACLYVKTKDNIGKTAEAYCSPEIWAAFLEELHSKGPEKRGSKTKPPSR
jgi:hypothetical protein